MQQDPLIPTADPEGRASLTARESFDIPQHHDLTLTRRQISEGGGEDRRQGRRIEPIVALIGPPLERIGPLALGVEAGRIDGMQGFDRCARVLC